MEWQAELPHDHAFVELLPPGVPSETDLQQLLRDTEDKLRLNACSIEQSLKELQAQMGESWTGERPPSPTECLQWFSPRNPGAVRPVATGNQELLDFLRALLVYLRSEEAGREDAVLQLLLSLSSQCGVSFPNGPAHLTPAPATAAATPTPPPPPVHAVRDDSALEVQEAWDEVRLLLRRHLLERLGVAGRGGVARRIRGLQQLCFLHPEAEVLWRYQVLRAQAVLALVRGALGPAPGPAPGGETGFDRLAAGLRAAAPALTDALREELLVLNGVAEPHAALGFLNAAYLGTVARELAVAMERERESALRDNTGLGGKARKASARAKASVAPLEPPSKDRTFSLTSHQLGALTQLASALLALESSVEELATHTAFINCAGETVRGILKKTREDFDMSAMDGGKTNADLLFHSPEAVVLEFDWRAAFRELVPQMARCVTAVLNEVSAKSLLQEEELHASGHAPVALSNAPSAVDSSPIYSESEAPKMVAKFSADITKQLDRLLPLALACRERPLLEVRCSFVEACARATSAVLGRLEERAGGALPSPAPLKTLPGLLATCVFVRQRLCLYDARLRDTSASAARVPLTLLPLQRYQEVTEAVREQLIGYCVQVCATSLLHDAESHHWADAKPFYEGERCSFSIQMWHYFLSGLRCDLWAVLPAAEAREVLGRVLCAGLQALVGRYSGARPSYKRHLQIRSDITAVLRCVEEFMWSVCDRPEALVRSDPSPHSGGGGHVPVIHSLCDQLLGVLVVVTAPLALLCGTFQSDPAERPAPVMSQAPGDPAPLWLHAIDPALFSQQAIRDGPAGEAASLCQLRLLTSDPGWSPGLLLQTLLHRDCHLPRLLLERSHFCDDGAAAVSVEHGEAGDAFVEALFNVLASLSGVPKALTQALEPYLESRHVWELLYTLADPVQPAPVVVSCVRAAVARPVHSLLGQLVAMAAGWQADEEPGGPLSTRGVPDGVLAKVPREWNYIPQDPRGREAARGGVTPTLQALSFLFANLPSAVSSLPLPVRFLFHAAEKRLSQHARQLRPAGLLLWALLGCLCRRLEDPDPGAGSALGRGARERLALLSECLQAAMGQQRGVPKPAVHKALQALEETRPKWASLQLQRARKLCSESAFLLGESAVQQGCSAAELTEQKMGLVLLEVCHRPGGSEDLRHISHIIRGNEELLTSQMTSPGDDREPSPHSVTFDLRAGHLTPRFNPITQFDHIGRNKFDQQAAMLDWTRLLPAYRGRSQLTFTAMLANRWEMQEAAVLDAEEQVLVEELVKAHLRPSSTGSPGPSEATAASQGHEQR